jgi:transposase
MFQVSVFHHSREHQPGPEFQGQINWLFSDTVNGARNSANLSSLIETAKANGLEPYAFPRRVFTGLPAASTLVDIETLLPWNTHGDRLQYLIGGALVVLRKRSVIRVLLSG